VSLRISALARGIVQGVGFRPFVYRIALAHRLVGWVRNGSNGVRIEVQGDPAAVEAFLNDLRHQLPPQAAIESLDVADAPLGSDTTFRIVDSAVEDTVQPAIPADLAICADCLFEINSPIERRYHYPFTNCTQCGPRFTIIEGLPYDRPRTAMQAFPLCDACMAQYGDPLDRRFHAQPIACPACGPQLSLLAADGHVLATTAAALQEAAEAILAGQILALKGLGGFQLLVDATNDAAVARLRQRKHREAKPFAVMFPSLDSVQAHAKASGAELAALTSDEAPIVLLARREAPGGDRVPLALSVAPQNPHLGAMLPYTPLHVLLMSRIGRPVVCTSGNLSEAPMVIDTPEALATLGHVADVFLVHDRPVVRPVDDSIAVVRPDGLALLRRARGFAPKPLRLPAPQPTTLALGAHLKSTMALSLHDQVVVSQHLGDLHSVEGATLLDRTVADWLRFFAAQPEQVACDLHPDYASTRLAETLAARWQVPLIRVQHHHAHVSAAIAEFGLAGPVLGLVWDGTGYGTDGTIWGGEALVCEGADFERVAHLLPFPLPGGERAVREPRRSALGALYAGWGHAGTAAAADWFTEAELKTLTSMLDQGVQTPTTSSIGRLFDAVAALTGLHLKAGFEGQPAMALEFAADGIPTNGGYELPLGDGLPAIADWRPLLKAIQADRRAGVPVGVISARFHGALADLAVAIARRFGSRHVVLSGGCFQNRRLVSLAAERLSLAGFQAHVPRLFPPNDGGIALGQVFVAGRRHAGEPPDQRLNT
jgi:hydrogenase maturation protein HypF